MLVSKALTTLLFPSKERKKKEMMDFMSRGFLWCGCFVREGLLQDRKWWVETLVVLIIPVVECIWEKVLK